MTDLRELAATVLRRLRARGLASEVNFDTISAAHSIFETVLRDASIILLPLTPVIDVTPPPVLGGELQTGTFEDYARLTDQLAGIGLRLAAIAERLETTENLDMADRAEIVAGLRAAIVDQSNLRMSIENMIHAFADQVQAATDGGNLNDVKGLLDDLRAGSSAIASDVMANTPAAHLAGPAAAGAATGGPTAGGAGAGPTATARTLNTTTPLPTSPAEGDKFTATWSDGSTTPLTFRGGQWTADDGSGSIDASGTWVPTPAGGGAGPTSTNAATQGTGPAAGAMGNRTGAGVA